jgi:hypothetical protein
MRNAITGLVRGYADPAGYEALIRRNQHIALHVLPVLGAADTDLILFHEGNIPESHQQFINARSGLASTFVDLRRTPPGSGFDPARELPNEAREMAGFRSGYRHMCHFWFIDFFDYLQGYRYVARIDEDCAVMALPDAFGQMQAQGWVYAAGGVIPETDTAIIGLAEFVHFFRARQRHPFMAAPEVVSGPMTNLMFVDLAHFRADPNFIAFQQAVKASGMVYTHRWGDLPLWGEYLRLYVSPERLHLDWKDIRYYHGSHRQMVNAAGASDVTLQSLRNIAVGKRAVCSSSYPGHPSNPSAAVNGHPSGLFAFHTDDTPEPSWEVDLESVHALQAVRILNRGDACKERAVGLVVEVSEDHHHYARIHTQTSGFGGLLDPDALLLDFRALPTRPTGRYLRLRLPRRDYLHLDQVEIYA